MRSFVTSALMMFLLFGQQARAQFTNDTVDVGDRPFLLAEADFDNDGDVDLATTNFASNSVSILVNDGSGGFSVDFSLSITNSPLGIVAADLDGDGDTDLAVSAEEGSGDVDLSVSAQDGSVNGNIRIIQNTLVEDGSLGFSVGPSFGVDENPRYVVAADFDEDADIDLAVAERKRTGNNVTVLENNGSTPGSYSFPQAARLSAGTQPIGLVVGNLDSDTQPDLAVANFNSDNVSLFENTSTASGISFSSQGTVAAGGGEAGVTAADLDGDGDLDLTVANFSDNSVTVLENNGSFSFSNSSTPPVPEGPADPKVADFDGDGDLDLVVSQYASGSTSVYFLENDGSLNFSPFPVSSQPVGNRPYGVVAGDFDGNTSAGPDVAIANFGASGAGTVSILLRNGGPLPIEEVNVNLSDRYQLTEARPNPFRDATKLTLTVAERQPVRVEVFDVMGRRVALLHDGTVPAKEPTAFRFEGTSLAGGTYMIRVTGRSFSGTRTVTLLK